MNEYREMNRDDKIKDEQQAKKETSLHNSCSYADAAAGCGAQDDLDARLHWEYYLPLRTHLMRIIF